MTHLMNKYKLIIFDMDGTLADRETGELLDGVDKWFSVYRHNTGGTRVAIATNQGGVGLRYWMEKDGFGEPEKYPTEDTVFDRINDVIQKLGISSIEIPVHVSFRYVSKKGNVSPLPKFPDETKYSQRVWSAYSRKPKPGMLLDAMSSGHFTPDETLMVGDRDEDKAASAAAGCSFQWAWDFFGRDRPEQSSTDDK